MFRLVRSVAALLCVLALTACMTREERMAANNAKDDQQCLSYGARKGTDAYVNCRAQLEGARRQADAAEAAANAADDAARRPRHCHDTGGYGGSTIICY